MFSGRRPILPTRVRRRLALTAALVAAAPLLAPAAPAVAASKAPRLTTLRCIPATTKACKRTPTVSIGDQLRVRGTHLERGQRVTFRWSKGALKGKLASSAKLGLNVRVPVGVAAGRVGVTVTDSAGRRSNRITIKVVATPAAAPALGAKGRALPAVFAGTGQWIWVLAQADGGTPDAIAARAQATGVTTLFVKAADGKDADPQFTPALVAALHAHGLRVCGWQVLYGLDPAAEAAAAIASRTTGEDCFVINAEDQYAGKYAQASQYVAAVRGAVGAAFPVGFTSHPYVDAHASVPYSVFLGAGGAQADLPQVYWKDLGSSVDASSARTLATNRIYGQPIAPIGQQWDDPAPTDIARFRAVWAGYGATGVSWWRSELSSPATWGALSAPAPAAAPVADPGWPALTPGASGDMVLRLQQLLAVTQRSVKPDGVFGQGTLTAIKAFQKARGLPATGKTDAATWQALLG
ncbi:MAG: peptidoglycan-binding domain-containing protein [Solirubrobacteraceae bacterium]|nr:peptidoglycan-binding domain-containing protein [Patulibacter sp.]